MFVHTVYFWLKEDLADADRAAFVEGLASLEAVEPVKDIHIGAAVPSDRPVVDASFSYALTVIFADKAGHDIYQDHPLHRGFVDTYARMWDRVQIYDAQ